MITSSAKFAATESGIRNSILPLEPETSIEFPVRLIFTLEGTDIGFFATLDIIKKPHKLLLHQYSEIWLPCHSLILCL